MEVYVYDADGSAKGFGPYGLSGSVGGGGGFGVEVCSGCKGLLMVSGEDELLLNELNELDRSTGVVLNREEEKLGMPHWQHIQDVLLLSARI